MIIDPAVIISACINLFHIFLQTSKEIFYPLKGHFTILNIKSNPICQRIYIQIRKLVYDITKSKNQHYSKYFSLPIFQYNRVPFSVYACSVHIKTCHWIIIYVCLPTFRFLSKPLLFTLNTGHYTPKFLCSSLNGLILLQIPFLNIYP